jgi:hypothetical protein
MSDSHDWMTVLQQHVTEAPTDIDLQELRPGDRLRIVTRNTSYDLVLLEGRYADLKTDRADRPCGQVQIMGCTFGMSSSIKPDHLFCGGNLEFTFEGGTMTHLTSVIREIHWLRRATGG